MILADDFTGACDAAGAFGAALHTVVVTAPPPAWPADVEVLALDLDVRERPSAEAHAAMASAARLLGQGAGIFVKIDSTLRGPVGALVRGALEGSARACAMVAPAFPEQGRHVVDGHLVVAGQRTLRVSDVVGDVPHVVVDADGPAPLRGLAADAEQHPEWLLVGSAGLARQLAPRSPTRVSLPNRRGPVVVVAGSPTRVTREQLEPLYGLPNVTVLATPPTEARDSGQAARALAAVAAQQVPGVVILTGGATARAVMHAVRARHLRVLGELQPGIPVGVLQDGQWHGLRVVTKAGGFGGPTTLLDVVRAVGPSSA